MWVEVDESVVYVMDNDRLYKMDDSETKTFCDVKKQGMSMCNQ